MKTKLMALLILGMLVLTNYACAPTSPPPQNATPTPSIGTEHVTGCLAVQDGRIFEYRIVVPQNWTGKYEIREEGNIAFFDYNASPEHTLFAIVAFTETQWQEAQKEPGHGTELLSEDGIVFVYNIALDNPYTGNQAEEFQQMAGQVQSVVSSLEVSLVP